jgi:hypothetical protein
LLLPVHHLLLLLPILLLLHTHLVLHHHLLLLLLLHHHSLLLSDHGLLLLLPEHGLLLSERGSLLLLLDSSIVLGGGHSLRVLLHRNILLLSDHRILLDNDLLHHRGLLSSLHTHRGSSPLLHLDSLHLVHPLLVGDLVRIHHLLLCVRVVGIADHGRVSLTILHLPRPSLIAVVLHGHSYSISFKCVDRFSLLQ